MDAGTASCVFVIQIIHWIHLSRQAYICDAAVDEVSGLSDTIAGCWTSKGKKNWRWSL